MEEPKPKHLLILSGTYCRVRETNHHTNGCIIKLILGIVKLLFVTEYTLSAGEDILFWKWLMHCLEDFFFFFGKST